MSKYNYMSEKELKTFGYTTEGAKWFDMQIALGLRSCETFEDVLELLLDVRQHERDIRANNSLKND